MKLIKTIGVLVIAGSIINYLAELIPGLSFENILISVIGYILPVIINPAIWIPVITLLACSLLYRLISRKLDILNNN